MFIFFSFEIKWVCIKEERAVRLVKIMHADGKIKTKNRWVGIIESDMRWLGVSEKYTGEQVEVLN